jgi:hypothetical protein
VFDFTRLVNYGYGSTLGQRSTLCRMLLKDEMLLQREGLSTVLGPSRDASKLLPFLTTSVFNGCIMYCITPTPFLRSHAAAERHLVSQARRAAYKQMTLLDADGGRLVRAYHILPKTVYLHRLGDDRWIEVASDHPKRIITFILGE